MALFQRKPSRPALRLVHSAPVEPEAADPVSEIDRHAARLAALAVARRRRGADRGPEHWSIAAHSALSALRP